MIIDTHCHLVSRKYEDLQQLRADSVALGVMHCVSQGTAPEDWEPQLQLAAAMPDFVSSCLAVRSDPVCRRPSRRDRGVAGVEALGLIAVSSSPISSRKAGS